MLNITRCGNAEHVFNISILISEESYWGKK